ncbi:MAG: Trm112 family protein [Myxococcota bacterium]
MALSEDLLAILRCPETKEKLIYFPDGDQAGAESFLFCPASRLRFSIGERDLPVMLVDEATRVDETECDRLVETARRLGLPVPMNDA